LDNLYSELLAPLPPLAGIFFGHHVCHRNKLARHLATGLWVAQRFSAVIVSSLKKAALAAEVTCAILPKSTSFNQIGIGGAVTCSPLPHHRTCGSAYGGSVRLS